MRSCARAREATAATRCASLWVSITLRYWSPTVGTLTVHLRRVVHRPEHFQQLLVAHDGGVERHLYDLGMARAVPADLAVGGVLRVPAAVAAHGLRHARDLAKHPLHAPETSCAERRCLDSSSLLLRPSMVSPSGANVAVHPPWVFCSSRRRLFEPGSSGDDLADGGDQEELTEDHLHHGERLPGVGGRHQVAVAGRGERREAEEQVVGGGPSPCAPKKLPACADAEELVEEREEHADEQVGGDGAQERSAASTSGRPTRWRRITYGARKYRSSAAPSTINVLGLVVLEQIAQGGRSRDHQQDVGRQPGPRGGRRTCAGPARALPSRPPAPGRRPAGMDRADEDVRHADEEQQETVAVGGRERAPTDSKCSRRFSPVGRARAGSVAESVLASGWDASMSGRDGQGPERPATAIYAMACDGVPYPEPSIERRFNIMAQQQANRYDAIVIGGGHNGLIAGAYLAKYGARTVVLEARHKTGGAADTMSPWPEAPDIKVTTLSYVMSLMPADDPEGPAAGAVRLQGPSTGDGLPAAPERALDRPARGRGEDARVRRAASPRRTRTPISPSRHGSGASPTSWVRC